MPHAYIIEVAGQTAGLAYREGNVFRFVASARTFSPLDGRTYGSPTQIERAARNFARETQRHARLPARAAIAAGAD